MKAKSKHFRSITAALVITILTGGLVQGQAGGQQGPPPVPSDKQITKMVKEVDKELSLNDEQKKQVSELYFAHFDEVENLQKNNQRPSREKMQKLDSGFETDVMNVLDEDQQKLYTAWLKKQEKQRSQGGQRPQGGQRSQGGQGPPR